MLYTDLFSDDTGSFFRSPVRDIFKKVDLNSIYSFAGGYPSAETFPLDTFREIMSGVIEKYRGQAFQYGATQGVTELRKALSDIQPLISRSAPVIQFLPGRHKGGGTRK